MAPPPESVEAAVTPTAVPAAAPAATLLATGSPSTGAVASSSRRSSRASTTAEAASLRRGCAPDGMSGVNVMPVLQRAGDQAGSAETGVVSQGAAAAGARAPRE